MFARYKRIQCELKGGTGCYAVPNLRNYPGNFFRKPSATRDAPRRTNCSGSRASTAGRRKYLLLLVFVLLLPGIRVRAQQADSGVPLYQRETIYMQGTGRFVKNNVVYVGHSQLLREFSVSPQGMSLYLRSRRNRNLGLAISLIGTAGTLYALFNRDKNHSRTFFWVSLGTGLIAAPLNMTANNQLNRAVWIRNRDALALPHTP